jgi:hypothetical protein
MAGLELGTWSSTDGFQSTTTSSYIQTHNSHELEKAIRNDDTGLLEDMTEFEQLERESTTPDDDDSDRNQYHVQY